MRDDHTIAVVIPVLDEAPNIGNVLDAIPEWVDDIVVADNGSRDATPEIAREHGVRVVTEPRRGYGSACLKGIAALDAPDIVVFLDGDFSDHPEQMDRLVDPIIRDGMDMVIGSRARGNAEPGALTPQARFGNWLATHLMRMVWRTEYTDLGPFRAIRYPALMRLGMADPDYGWTVEMQIKATLHRLRSAEAPVDYRKREGRSKVSGTLRGVIGAAYKILGTILVSAARHYLGRHIANRACRLIIFTRYPEPGKTKTRLIPELGPEGAADLQRDMTEHTVHTARRFGRAEVSISFTGADDSSMRAWLGETLHYTPQSEGDLGERMKYVFESSFMENIDNAVIIGVDSPEIDTATLEAAFAALARNQIVLGPATDGGYYLIGLRRDALPAAGNLFIDMPWGTDQILADTLERANKLQLAVATLAPLDDVDRPEDLDAWKRATEPENAPLVSIIIPARNEAERIRTTLESVQSDPRAEALVVDGGSDDETIAIAKAAGASVYTVRGGRGAQMNFGAAKARAQILCFLHADTRLPEGFVDYIIETLALPNTAAGAFRFDSDYRTRSMRIIGRFTNLRARYRQLPYGDQALFMSKYYFRRIGGYKTWPIMEDYRLAKDLRHLGNLRIARASVSTCGRRFRRLGPWRTMLINQTVIAGYHLGISLDALARWYRSHA